MIVAPKTISPAVASSHRATQDSPATNSGSLAPRTQHAFLVPSQSQPKSRSASNASASSSYSYTSQATPTPPLKSKLKKQAPSPASHTPSSVSFQGVVYRDDHHMGSSSSVSTQESQWSIQNNVSSPKQSRLNIATNSVSHRSLSDSPTRNYFISEPVSFKPQTPTSRPVVPVVSIPAGLRPQEILARIPPSYLQDRNFYNTLDGTRIHPDALVPCTPLDDLIDDILMPVTDEAQLDTNVYNPYDGTRVHPPPIPDFVKFAHEFAAFDEARRLHPAGPRLNPFARAFVPGSAGVSGAHSATTARSFNELDAYHFAQGGRKRANSSASPSDRFGYREAAFRLHSDHTQYPQRGPWMPQGF
ncbi:hypothetical protein BC830DRAFT_200159 [Chytriomyces sp. MP71]|nr:hypothetical protein BC830DRAFT_200159 [Chytriomyces sp. MP71]